jgi:hypothetical protein
VNSPIEKIVDHIPPKIDYPLLSPKNGRDLLQVSLTYINIYGGFIYSQKDAVSL